MTGERQRLCLAKERFMRARKEAFELLAEKNPAMKEMLDWAEAETSPLFGATAEKLEQDAAEIEDDNQRLRQILDRGKLQRGEVDVFNV
jgi:hypothetical protein